MAEDQTLREAAEAQANALSSGDLAAFASYADPLALTALYRGGTLRTGGSFKLAEVSEDSPAFGHSEVRGSGTCRDVIRSEWSQTAAGWKAVSLRITPRPRRWPGGRIKRAHQPAREDLS